MTGYNQKGRKWSEFLIRRDGIHRDQLNLEFKILLVLRTLNK